MNTSLWVICIMFALVLGAFCAVIWGTKQKEKEYETGYNLGYENGGREKYNEVYGKRLLRQSQRASAKEKQITDAKPEDREPVENLLDLGLNKAEE